MDFNTYLNKSIGCFQKNLLQKKFLRKVLTPEIYELLESYFMLSPVQRSYIRKSIRNLKNTTYKPHRSSPAGEEPPSSGLTLKPLSHILSKPVFLSSET